MAYSALRTLVNRAGIVFDELKTHVVFAEDMNAIKGNIEYLESKRSDISTILNVANLGSGYLTRWDGSKLVNSKIYDNGTNVGIGTTSPNYPLDVMGTMQMQGSTTGYGIRLIPGVSNPAINLISGAGTFSIARNGDDYSLSHSYGIKITPNKNITLTPGSGYDTLITTGNVGIGTTNPIKKLDVNGTGRFTNSLTLDRQETTGLVENIYLSRSGAGGNYGLIGTRQSDLAVVIYGMGGDPLSLGANGTPDMLYIKTNGNVGIGTTSPTAKLDILSDILRLRTAKTPATAGAAGNQGDMCWDSGYLYICVSTNAWVRSALATW